MAAFQPFSLNLKGRLVRFNRPAVMGIINVTPDSFYAGSRTSERETIEKRVTQMIAEGAEMIDLGGYSSRPGADEVPVEEEKRRLKLGMEIIREHSADIPVSIDTFRADVARSAIEEYGADIVNDISGGLLDSEMIPTVASMHVPYILMHMRGTPETMQQLTDYEPDGVTAVTLRELGLQLDKAAGAGIADVIIDPGFGFAKTLDQNYRLMADLEAFKVLGCPVLVGISRKSMITRLLGITSEEALNATTVLNTLSLDRGAGILRVHDVKAAREAVDIFMKL